MDAEGLVVAVSAGAGAAVAVGESMRRYWRRREDRQRAAFTISVGQIVDARAAELRALLAEVERRQGKHLDRQDRAIAELRQAVALNTRRLDDRLP